MVRPALPWDYFRLLQKSFPEEAILSQRPVGENERIDLHAKDSHGKVNDVWENFIAYHTSNMFWQDVLQVFEPAFNVCYPHLIDLKSAGTSVRGMGPGGIQMECQPGVNTPTSTRSRVRKGT